MNSHQFEEKGKKIPPKPKEKGKKIPPKPNGGKNNRKIIDKKSPNINEGKKIPPKPNK